MIKYRNVNTNDAVKVLGVSTLVVFVFILGHLSAYLLYGYGKTNSSGNQGVFGITQSSGSNNSLDQGDFAIFWDVYNKLNGNYIDKKLPEDSKLVEGATKGLISALGDKYTNYYTKDEWQKLQESNSGKFQGIGIKLQQGNESILIESVVRGGPAEKSGIIAGDLITEVEKKKVGKQTVFQIAEQIRGEKGTSVNIKIYRPTESKTYDFKVTRDEIDMDSIEYKKLEDGGYQIIITRFTEDSFSEFQTQWLNAVETIQKDNPKYIILDLRGNTGGWVDAAKFVIGEFLPAHTVAFKEVDRDGHEVLSYTDREGVFQKVPMVVLVNESTASSSEIVSGALRAHNRAKLVGKPTLGKGVEQTVLPTEDGGSVHIVFKRWFTPDGKNLSESNALKPDVEVDMTLDDVKAKRDPQLEKAVSMLKSK